MPLVHFFEGTTRRPPCGAAASNGWNWTIDPRAVTCPDCARLAVQASVSPDSLAASWPRAMRP